MDEMNIQMPDKPSSVARVEFIDGIANLINNSGLPAFVMEPILRDMYIEVQNASSRQYEYDKGQYEQAVQQVLSAAGAYAQEDMAFDDVVDE